MVNIPVLHLGLDVPDPQHDGSRIDIESALEDGAGALEFLLLEFPLGVTHPVVHIYPVPADIVFELFPLPALEFMQLLQICEALGGRLQTLFLTIDSFTKELLGGDLNRRGGLVLDPRGAP